MNFRKTLSRNSHYVDCFDCLVALSGDKYISDIDMHIKVQGTSKNGERVAYSVRSAMHFVASVIIEYFEAQKAFHLKIRYINM